MTKPKQERGIDDNSYGLPPPPPLKSYSFRLEGHGHDIDGGTFMAQDEERAFREAYKACRRLELPGWTLYCIETKTRLAVASFFDKKDKSFFDAVQIGKGVRAKRVRL